MSAYQGGKKKIFKYICPLLQTYLDDEKISLYIEPFCGMFSVGSELAKRNPDLTIKAFDVKENIILFWQGVKEGWRPKPTGITKQEYLFWLAEPPCREQGYYCHQFAILGKFGSSYNTGIKCNRKIVQQLDAIPLKNVEFKLQPYQDLEATKRALIYCDPPYRNTCKFKDQGKFDSDAFWDWVREQSKSNTVVVSELSAPDDFVPIWSKEIHFGHCKRVEKLYIINGNNQSI